jgi:aspartyl-tRNA(Asn)/glutamyl-tRNA(Gln) amidotransferase subunit A
MSLADLTLVELTARIARREVSAVEATEAALRRAEALQPKLNAFVALRAEQAMAQARAVDDGKLEGPLAGAPLAHKDMYYREGQVSSCGSRILRQRPAPSTATALARLDAAGAIDLGGLNMTEFAVGPLGHNAHTGAIHNPWNTAHAPGGSSSGSGASTAARIVCGALGSDTGGSIRLPSSFCGVVGIKPTQTRVSRHGAMPLAFSFDCVGPLARSARDAARLLGVIAGEDPLDATSSARPVDDYEAACGRDPKGLRLGVPKTYYDEALHPDAAAALEAARRQFATLGVELVEVDVPDHEPINMLWQIVLSAEAAAIHRKWLRERPEDYQPQVKRRIELGLYLPATRYVEALAARGPIAAEFLDKVFSRCDAMLTPTTPFPAPRLDETDIGAKEGALELILRISQFTRPISYLGFPALSAPCGFSADGLPIGMQLVGRPFAEATLFQLAHAYEQATDWTKRKPAPTA